VTGADEHVGDLLDVVLPSRPASSLGGTLRAIGDATVGPALLAVVALGFVAFGVVELLSASYRRINVQ